MSALSVRPRAGRFAVALALLSTSLLGLTPGSASAVELCNGVASDFNGDSLPDQAIFDLSGAAGSVLNAGRVAIVYGVNGGDFASGPVTVLTQGSAVVGGTPQPGEQFGSSPVVVDLNNDSCSDLVVGSPGEEVDDHLGAGAVSVIFGAPGGIGTGAATLTFDATDFGRTADPDAAFGSQIAAVSSTSSGHGLIAAGAPGGRSGGREAAGWVAVFDLPGLTKTVYDQNSAGVPGTPEIGDAFGRAVAFGRLTGKSAEPDLVVGAPNEDNGKSNNGTITVIPDPLAGGGNAKYYDQNTSGVPGTAENGDTFGYSLRAGSVGGSSWLAVGVPGESVGPVKLAGAVQLFSSNGSTLKPAASFNQNTKGVSGSAETADFFGETLALATPGRVGDRWWLAVGTPHEKGAATASGLVQIFPLDDLAAERTYSQSTAGVQGVSEALDYFGSALGFNGRAVLVGVPDDHEFSSGMVDVIPLDGGAPTAWRPGLGNIPASGWESFGSGFGTR